MTGKRYYLEITSFSNEKLKYISGLKEKKNREKADAFFIEGYREISRALTSGKIKFEYILTCPECYLGENEDALVESVQAKTIIVPKPIFEKISYRDRPDGLIATAFLPDFSLPETIPLNGSPILVVEGVEKPGNLGTILRTAEGAGFNTIFVADPKLDLLNPNVIRSSTGTLFTLNVYQSLIQNLYPVLKKEGYKITAVTPEAKSVYWDSDLKGKIALVFGSEQYGLSEFARSKSDLYISLPMKGHADSLNLAMSAGILMYEVLRQNK
ncbi:RNA methyltransferase, TrmH family [Leptospira fainei serovar Hurstbridge str. BUT 6]|uniref:RNA methyltransferase, TrmH family n=1 Tax=Leptospira fainei serovar Hurstbridge str. BUT 6 TaxID=1193011 RepID=S3URR9_9LEPT|nr:RNA methyltransferase [Leptospira fainei]EPG73106.1 RNA methyltransferase, TrmH family [Leptospira fainei serovar Hurstbridge str. BUT 6]